MITVLWPVFQKIADQLNAPIYRADVLAKTTYETDLKGAYQQFNLRTAISVLEILQKGNWTIEQSQIEQGLLNVVNNTGLMGRWQILGSDPNIICDTAHNKEGLELVIQQLLKEDYQDLYIVLGTLSDKDLQTILPLFPKDAYYYFTTPGIPRALSANELKEAANNFGLKGEVVEEVIHALKSAKQRANPEDIIFVGGSTFVVAEVL